jgi:hypothetical protein
MTVSNHSDLEPLDVNHPSLLSLQVNSLLEVLTVMALYQFQVLTEPHL